MIWCVHAFTGTKTANLSEPIACMNCSIASLLPRTWQDINRSLDPTVASNWRLSIKRYTPPPSKPAVVFSLNEADDKITLLDVFNLWNISKGVSFSSCTRHKETGDILLCLCMPPKNHVMLWNNVTGSLTSLSMIRLLLWLCSSGMLKKMTGSFNYLSCSVISDNKYKIRTEIIQQ